MPDRSLLRTGSVDESDLLELAEGRSNGGGSGRLPDGRGLAGSSTTDVGGFCDLSCWSRATVDSDLATAVETLVGPAGISGGGCFNSVEVDSVFCAAGSFSSTPFFPRRGRVPV